MEMLNNKLEEIENLIGNIHNIHNDAEIYGNSLNVSEIHDLCKQCKNVIKQLENFILKIKNRQIEIRNTEEKVQHLLSDFKTIKENVLLNFQKTLDKSKEKNDPMNLSDIIKCINENDNLIKKLKEIIEEISVLDSSIANLCQSEINNVYSLMENLMNIEKSTENFIKEKDEELNQINDLRGILIDSIDFETLEILKSKLDKLNELKEQMKTFDFNDQYNFQEIHNLNGKSVDITDKINESIDLLNRKIEKEQEKETSLQIIYTNLDKFQNEIDNLTINLCSVESPLKIEEIDKRIDELTVQMNKLNNEIENNPIFSEFLLPEEISSKINKINEQLNKTHQISVEMKDDFDKNLSIYETNRLTIDSQKAHLEHIKNDLELNIENDAIIIDIQKQLLESKNQLLKLENSNEYICSDKIEFEKSKLIDLENIDEILNNAKSISDNLQTMKIRKQFIEELEKCKTEANNLEELVECGDQNLNSDTILDRIKNHLNSLEDLEMKWKDNEILVDIIQNLFDCKSMSENIRNIFDDYLNKLEHNKNILFTTSELIEDVEDKLNNVLVNLSTSKDKKQQLDELKNHFQCPELDGVIIDNKFKESTNQFLEKQDIDLKIENLKRRISREIELEKIKLQLDEINRIFEIIYGDNGDKSLKDIINYVSQAKYLIDLIVKENGTELDNVEQFKEEIEMENGKINQIEKDIDSLNEKLKLSEIRRIDHVQKMSTWIEGNFETIDEIEDFRKSLKEYLENLINLKNNLSNGICCQETVDLSHSYSIWINETENILQTLNNEENILIEKNELLTKFNDIKNGIQRLIDIESGEKECLFRKEIEEIAEEIKEKIDSFQKHMNSFEKSLKENTKTELKLMESQVLNGFLEIQNIIDRKSVTLFGLFEDLKSVVEESIKYENIDNINDRDQLEIYLNDLTNLITKLSVIKTQLVKEGLYCHEQQQHISEIKMLSDNLKKSKDLLEKKIDLLLEEKIANENIINNLNQIIEKLTTFHLFLVEDNGYISFTKIDEMLGYIEKEFENILSSISVDNPNFEKVISNVSEKLIEARKHFTNLIGNILNIEKEFLNLENQLIELINEPPPKSLDCVDKYKHSEIVCKKLDKIRELCFKLLQDTIDLGKKIHCSENVRLKDNLEDFDGKLKTSLNDKETKLIEIIEILKSNLDEAKLKQESWLKESIKALQNSTQQSSLAPDLITLRKEALENLIGGLETGNELIERIFNLEEQMKLINNDFDEQQCTHRDRKTSVIQYIELINESQRRFMDISDKYKQALEISQELFNYLNDIQLQLRSLEKENINYSEISGTLENLQSKRVDLESKVTMKDFLLSLEKALSSENVSTSDLMTIDVENLFVKTFEDIDDFIALMNEIVEEYNKLDARFISEKNALDIINEELKNCENENEQSLHNQSDKLMNLKEDLLTHLSDLNKLRNDAEMFHSDKNVNSGMISKIREIENDSKTIFESINKKLVDRENLRISLNQANIECQQLCKDLDDVEQEIQFVKMENSSLQETDFWISKIGKLQDLSTNLSECNLRLAKLIDSVMTNSLELQIAGIKNRIVEDEKEIIELQKNWQFLLTVLNEKENILTLINFIESRIKFSENCENEIDLLNNTINNLSKLFLDINSLENKIQILISSKNPFCLSESDENFFNSVVENLENKLEILMIQLKTGQNKLDDKLIYLNKLNDLNEEILKLTKGIFSNPSDINDCDSLISTLNDLEIKLSEINHPEIIASKKQIIDHLANILNEAQSVIKEIQNKFHLFESIKNDLKSNELKLENAQNLFSNPQLIEVMEIEESLVEIENQLDSIEEIYQKHSLDLVLPNSNLFHLIDEDFSNQAQILNDLKIQLVEKRKLFDITPEETFEPTFVENVNRDCDFSFGIDNEETEIPQSESEASKRSENEGTINEDSANLVSNQNMNHKQELIEISDWIANEMESLNLMEKSVEFDNYSNVIKPFIEQLELKKNDLNKLENSLSQSDSKEIFTKELQLLKSKLASYEDYLQNTLENTTDLDNYLSNFRKTANFVFDWIKSSKSILNEEISPIQYMQMLEKLKEECYNIEITKIKQLEIMKVDIKKFDIVQANKNIQISVDLIFEQVMKQYNELCNEIIEMYNSSPMNELEKLIQDSEEFILKIFSTWYENQFRNTIISSKECMIRITENRIKLVFVEETSKKFNKLIDNFNLNWPHIYLDQELKFPTYDIDSIPNSVEIRYIKTAKKFYEIWKSLNKWMIILEDLKVKWQELNANQEQFQSWLIDIQRKEDLNDGKPLHLNVSSIKEKINFLKNLRSEIDRKSLELNRIMLIDDEVTTVTFSPELNNGENLRSTNTSSDKVNMQYTYLANKVNSQIEKWNNILDKVEMYHKSADDLKEDFTHLKEQIQKLEIQCPLAKDKINSLKSTKEPSFSQSVYKSNRIITNLRNSGSNRGISKLLWPYSRKSDHSLGDCEMNKSSQSLLCYNFEDVRSSREKQFSSTINLNCLTTSINSLSECMTVNDKLSITDCPSYRSDYSQSTNFMKTLPKLHISSSMERRDCSIPSSSRSERTVKRLKQSSSTNHSSGYRSNISLTSCSTYRS